MSEHIGGKGSGASSSSEFLRAYRIGVLAGANASYQTIPKKAALSYATTSDLLESRNKRGVLADLSGIVSTDCKCPTVPTGPTPPLVYVSTNNFAQLPAETQSITYVNTGDIYVSPFSSGFGIYALNPYRQILSGITLVNRMMQSLIDGKIYFVTSADEFLSYTVGGIGYTTLIGYSISLTSTTGITQDNLGNFYITTFFGSILKIASPYSSVQQIAVGRPFLRGITYASDGNLYVLSYAGGEPATCWRYNVNGVGELFFTFPGVFALTGILQANDGNLYISGFFYDNRTGISYNVARLTLTGEFTYFVASIGSEPMDIIQGADENFYLPAVNSTVYQIVVR
jgi:hypothetical protein